MPRGDLARPGWRLLLVGVSTHTRGSLLPDLPSADTTMIDSCSALTERCGFDQSQVTVLRNPESPVHLADAIGRAAAEAESAFLLWYTGHGLVSYSGALYLATHATIGRTSGLKFQALRLGIVSDRLRESRVQSVIVILDTCENGRAAADLMLGVERDARAEAMGKQACVLASTTSGAAATPRGARHTAFGGRLINLLRHGDPGCGRNLTVSHVAHHLARMTPTTTTTPRPRSWFTDQIGQIGDVVLASNPAYDAARPSGGSTSSREHRHVSGAQATAGTGTTPQHSVPRPATGPGSDLVLVSYVGSGKPWADWIVDQLETAGYRIRIMSSIFPESSGRMPRPEQLVQPACILAVISPGYSEFAARTDMEAGFARIGLAADRVIPIRTDAGPPPPWIESLGAVSLADPDKNKYTASAELLHRVDEATGSTPDIDGQARMHRRAADRGDSRTARYPAINRIDNLKDTVPVFTRRDEKMGELWAAFMRSPRRRCALRGLPGTGKTQLATDYANRHRGWYDVIWWIRAEQETLVNNAFSELARRLGIDAIGSDAKEIVRLVRDELRKRRRWLLVFDNAEQPSAVEPFLPSGEGHVLITSREGSEWGGFYRTLDVESFLRDESVDLLRRYLPTIEDVHAHEIADLVGDYPLAIEQAAAYMLETPTMTPASYTHLHRTRSTPALHKPYHYPDEVLKALGVSIDGLADRNMQAARLLRLLAFLGPELVPRRLLTGDAGLEEAVDPLCQSLLARVPREPQDGGDTLVVHRLVQIVVQAGLSPREKLHWLATAVRLLHRYLVPGGRGENQGIWPGWRQRLVPHVVAVFHRYKDLRQEFKKSRLRITSERTVDGHLLDLLDRAAEYLRSTGQRSQAKDHMEWALTVAKRHHGELHASLAERYTALGDLISNLPDAGGPARATDYYVAAFEVQEHAHQPDWHIDIAVSLEDLAENLVARGFLDKAVLRLQEAHDIYRSCNGPEDPAVVDCLRFLARIQTRLGGRDNLEAAHRIYREIYRISLAFYQEDRENMKLGAEVALSVQDVRRTLLALGRYQEEFEFAQEAARDFQPPDPDSDPPLV